MREGNEVKITTAYGVVEVTVNPGRKSDGRPNAGLSYTASLRCSSEGVVRLTLGTDFTPPCLLAVLPEFDFRAASAVIAELGIPAPAIDGWTEARPGVYAFVDGVRYGVPTGEELEFMAAFGFTPGARFDLALPMLRAQRAQLSGGASEVGGVAVEVSSGEMAVRMPVEALEVAAEIQAEEDFAQLTQDATFGSNALRNTLPAAPKVGGAGVPMEQPATPRETLPTPDTIVGPPSATGARQPARRRRAAKPAGKVEVVSQVLGESTEETLLLADDAVAINDVFDVLDAAPTPIVAKPPVVEPNPFMIEGL